MKTRLQLLFEKKPEKNLSLFITAGYPKKESLLEIIPILENAECDIIEIGIPFSDPLADGPVIQKSSTSALDNGMTLDLIFKQVKELRPKTSKPILLMGYLNSLLKFGIEDFYSACFDSGVDGLIIPDLPLSEYQLYHQAFVKKYAIDFVFLISPDTENKRAIELANKSSGFIYMVSSNSTTGNTNKTNINLSQKINELKENGLKLPLLIGFGIKDAKDFENACKSSNGAIIGSAFIQLVKNSNDLKKDIPEFILSIKTISYDHSIK
jgi:tryptophan synthase alpha chain